MYMQIFHLSHLDQLIFKCSRRRWNWIYQRVVTHSSPAINRTHLSTHAHTRPAIANPTIDRSHYLEHLC